ncbi:FecR domain-containing protein [bacterium]|nr:FecR domain-containing protein [bacterium]
MPRIPRKRPIDYILPFLIMISTGVIIVLGYQLWSTTQNSGDGNDIYAYTAQGTSKILPWGSGEWERMYNGTKLLQEDSIKTQTGGRVVVELFHDNYIRLDEKTEISFVDIKKDGDGYEVNVQLKEGKIWVNSNKNSEIPVKFTVSTNHTLIKNVSTIYEVEQTSLAEAVRVIKGDILADIMIDEDGKVRKVETLSVGVGQQAIITDKNIEAYTNRQSPSVIDAVSDDFRNMSFYKWNMAEDQHPTDFSIGGGSATQMVFDEEATEDVAINEGELAKPKITTPSTLTFTTPESSLTIRGTTTALTQKMMVDAENNGDTETYELNLYVPGNTEWSFAVSQVAGTLKPGVNTYEFYALGENELKSGKTQLIVKYQSDEVTDEEEINADLGELVAPEVISYNGKDSNVVDTDVVKVVGSVSGAKEINVSGYTLSAFEPGDTTWIYYARESLGNLDPGENKFTVTAIAPDGSKNSTDFTITYNKAEEEALAEDNGATEEPAV